MNNLFLLLALSAAPSSAALRVVTTTADLADLAREVGGDRVHVEALARGHMDPHTIDAKPSHLLKLKRADLFAQVGLELEIAWAPTLLQSARNPGILPGSGGFFDASASPGLDILGRVPGKVDRSMGDIHPEGNPHYWLDPANGAAVAAALAARLSELDPEGADAYAKNLADFRARLEAKRAAWKARAAKLSSKRFVFYHDAWANYAKAFGIEAAGFVEPKPGIPAPPAHVRELIAAIRREKIPLILVEPFFDLKLPRKIAAESGAKVVAFPASVGSAEARSYLDLFERQLALLEENLDGDR